MTALRWLSVLLLGLFVLEPTARAEGLGDLKIVVPNATGRRSYGTSRLTKGLRKHLQTELGVSELISPKALAKAQRKLKIRRRKRNKPEALARAAKEAGAEYVLSVRITKKKWLYTATAILIDANTGEEKMNFRAGYYKPKTEASDRGRRIAQRTREKLQELIGGASPAPDAMAAADAPGTDDAAADTAPDPTPSVTADTSSTDRAAPGDSAPAASDLTEKVSPEPSPAAVADATPDPEPAMPEPEPARISSDPSAADASATATVDVGPRTSEREIVRISLGAGSGFLHTYDLSSDAVAKSGLSYGLSPVALFFGQLEVFVPSVGVSVVARGAFSPVRYRIEIDETVEEPLGNLTDITGGLRVHLPVSGEGAGAIEIVPTAGIRFASIAVEESAAPVLLSSSSLIAFGGLGLRLPLNELLEISLSVDGGFVAAYSEDPLSGGDPGGGFAIGGDFQARLWLTGAIGIAVDSRFDFQQTNLDGAATRQAPVDETLENVAVTRKDLRTSVGLAFRF